MNALFLNNVREISLSVLSDQGKVDILAGARRHVERLSPTLDKVTITDLNTGKSLASFYSSTLSLCQSREEVESSEKEDDNRQKRLLSVESSIKETGDHKRMKIKSMTPFVLVTINNYQEIHI